LKAKSLNIIAEDYLTGKVRDVREKLYTGRTVVDEFSEEKIDASVRSWHGFRGRSGCGEAEREPLLHPQTQEEEHPGQVRSTYRYGRSRGEAECLRYQPEERGASAWP
jgi:hypothetical protein